MAIKIPAEQRKQSLASIKRYFLENAQEIGDLKAQLFLDFVLKEIAPCVYNQAIQDAQSFIHEKVTDLDGSCYETEFGYWPDDSSSDKR